MLEVYINQFIISKYVPPITPIDTTTYMIKKNNEGEWKNIHYEDRKWKGVGVENVPAFTRIDTIINMIKIYIMEKENGGGGGVGDVPQITEIDKTIYIIKKYITGERWGGVGCRIKYYNVTNHKMFWKSRELTQQHK